MRIYIIGVSGAGKTTLGNKLAYLYSFSLYSIDKLAVGPDGQPVSARDILSQMELSGEHWVVEGEFIMREVLERADKIIWLRASLLRTVVQIWKRYFTAGGTEREISLGQTIGLIFSSIASILFRSNVNTKELGFIPVANYHDVLDPYSHKLVIIRRYDPNNITSVVKSLNT